MQFVKALRELLGIDFRYRHAYRVFLAEIAHVEIELKGDPVSSVLGIDQKRPRLIDHR